MVHGYHVIWGTYGFWLPNDPRGSWSEVVYAWELARFGNANKSLDRIDVEPRGYAAWRKAARKTLRYPGVTLSEGQAQAAGDGFGRFVQKSGLTIWACSLLPEHVHLVVGRHRYKIESAANLLKGEATRRLVELDLHPMSCYRSPSGRLPSVWAETQWKVYLDDDEAIVNAIRYVLENPVREGMPAQCWSFVTPVAGIEKAGWTTYH